MIIHQRPLTCAALSPVLFESTIHHTPVCGKAQRATKMTQKNYL